MATLSNPHHLPTYKTHKVFAQCVRREPGESVVLAFRYVVDEGTIVMVDMATAEALGLAREVLNAAIDSIPPKGD